MLYQQSSNSIAKLIQFQSITRFRQHFVCIYFTLRCAFVKVNSSSELGDLIKDSDTSHRIYPKGTKEWDKDGKRAKAVRVKALSFEDDRSRLMLQNNASKLQNAWHEFVSPHFQFVSRNVSCCQ